MFTLDSHDDVRVDNNVINVLKEATRTAQQVASKFNQQYHSTISQPSGPIPSMAEVYGRNTTPFPPFDYGSPPPPPPPPRPASAVQSFNPAVHQIDRPTGPISLTSDEVEYCRRSKPFMVKATFSMFDPHPEDKLKRVRVKPPGCRTVYVSNMPLVISDVICAEIFSTFGAIENLELNSSKTKNDKITKFCNLKFVKAKSADRALKYNGCYLLVSKPGTPIMPHQVGQLQVDFATDDQDVQEWERDQRIVDRMTDNCPAFSEAEATRVMQFLRDPLRLVSAANVVKEWCQTGQCTRLTSKTFYSLITTVNATVKRLPYTLQDFKETVKKNKADEEWQKNDLENYCK